MGPDGARLRPWLGWQGALRPARRREALTARRGAGGHLGQLLRVPGPRGGPGVWLGHQGSVEAALSTPDGALPGAGRASRPHPRVPLTRPRRCPAGQLGPSWGLPPGRWGDRRDAGLGAREAAQVCQVQRGVWCRQQEAPGLGWLGGGGAGEAVCLASNGAGPVCHPQGRGREGFNAGSRPRAQPGAAAGRRAPASVSEAQPSPTGRTEPGRGRRAPGSLGSCSPGAFVSQSEPGCCLWQGCTGEPQTPGAGSCRAKCSGGTSWGSAGG